MASTDLHYFTCTLGQAAKWNEKHLHEFKTINDLVDEQAREIPDRPAIGFADWSAGPDAVVERQNHSLNSQTYTFLELKTSSFAASLYLSQCLGDVGINQSATIGLISISSAEFLLTWLGLIRLGCPVVLLAPQLEPSAIEHLCAACNVQAICFDPSNRGKVESLSKNTKIIDISDILSKIDDPPAPTPFDKKSRCEKDVAYFSHTSGTSSGLPKPIPRTHHAAVNVLPKLPNQENGATFSTTPLYHGGIADCFRAWTSGVMIWLFPEARMPVTAQNILKCIEFGDQQRVCRIHYFSSVPYILQILSESEDGIFRLQQMAAVGVGGAALPTNIGDSLVAKGINLLSRYGSAECGFLMSSDRSFETDTDWQYLRSTGSSDFFAFEPRDDGLVELVVRPSWPHLSKINREDGSFATSDLFEPHPKIANAWRYHSRSDAQITLANGKKFDPSPIEGSILSLNPGLKDVLIFGSGQYYPGILLFPRDKSVSDEEILRRTWSSVENINQETQSHARLAKHMLVVVVGDEHEPPLSKSSKGTILRGKAEERYAQQIDLAYKSRNGDALLVGKLQNEDLINVISRIFHQVVGRDIDPDQDIYQQGVDSISCVQIRNIVGATVLHDSAKVLPLNIIYDCRTIKGFATYLIQLQSGSPEADGTSEQLVLDQMRRFVHEYGDFSDVKSSQPKAQKGSKVVLLTGATGMLGAHILHFLRNDQKFTKIYCLLRATTALAAHERVTKSLIARGLPGLDILNEDNQQQQRVTCVQCKLSEPDLGLSESDWSTLSSSVSTIIHSAWTVNFSLNLSSFTDHFAGIHSLLRLSMEAGARLLFISSTASVLSSPTLPVPESLAHDPSSASPLGYSRAKWVAEQICAAAHTAIRSTSAAPKYQPSSISILRVGQLCGNQEGIWNMSEAFPLVLSTARVTGCLPDLQDVPLSWLPVDAAAKVVLEVEATMSAQHRPLSHEVPVYHILNPHKTPNWENLLRWIQEDVKQQPDTCHFKVVVPSEWIASLEANLKFDTDVDSGRKWRALLPLWKESWGSDVTKVDHASQESRQDRSPSFETHRTANVSQFMSEIQPLEREHLLRMWRWIQEQETRSTSLDKSV